MPKIEIWATHLYKKIFASINLSFPNFESKKNINQIWMWTENNSYRLRRLASCFSRLIRIGQNLAVLGVHIKLPPMATMGGKTHGWEIAHLHIHQTHPSTFFQTCNPEEPQEDIGCTIDSPPQIRDISKHLGDSAEICSGKLIVSKAPRNCCRPCEQGGQMELLWTSFLAPLGACLRQLGLQVVHWYSVQRDISPCWSTECHQILRVHLAFGLPCPALTTALGVPGDLRKPRYGWRFHQVCPWNLGSDLRFLRLRPPRS